MPQLDLFDNQQLSRRTDKPTSHAASDGVRQKLGLLKQRCVWILGSFELTAMEVAKRAADYYGGLADSYRKRFHELVRDGLIEELPPRECSVTGKNATVYKRKGE